MKGKLVIAAYVLIWAWGLVAWSTAIAHAQEYAPHGQAAYLLDHPIDPDRLVLATPEGRFQVSRSCEWMASYTNVLGFSTGDAQVVALTPSDLSQPLCFVDNLGLVDQTPCFGYGVCDVSYEMEE